MPKGLAADWRGCDITMVDEPVHKSSARVIDVWMQQPTAAFLAHEMFAPLRRWMRSGVDERLVDPSTTVAAMEEAGVTTGMICAWCSPKGWLITNDEAAAVVRAYPDRFVGIASADLSRPMEAVRELRRCVEHLGFKGLRIVPWLWSLPPDDRRYYPLYAACVELDIPFCLQVGHTGPLYPSEFGRPIPYLDHVALEFPELRIVAGHIGFPWTTEMIALATKYQNVHIDTSAYVPTRYPRELADYMRGRGRTKVLFGTNYPMLPFSRCVSEVDELRLDADERADFLHRNAERVFKLTGSGTNHSGGVPR